MKTIGDTAKAADLPAKTVRYYADIGLVAPSARSDGGYRLYSDDEVARLIFIRRARAFGFSIEDCRELLSLYEDRNRTSAEVKRIAERHLGELKKQLSEMQALQKELALLVSACAGDDRPDCPILAGMAGASRPASGNGAAKRKPARKRPPTSRRS